jgi:hypothetical protein
MYDDAGFLSMSERALIDPRPGPRVPTMAPWPGC